MTGGVVSGVDEAAETIIAIVPLPVFTAVDGSAGANSVASNAIVSVPAEVGMYVAIAVVGVSLVMVPSVPKEGFEVVAKETLSLLTVGDPVNWI